MFPGTFPRPPWPDCQVCCMKTRAAFLAFFAARFSSSVLAGFFFSCFFWFIPLLMAILPSGVRAGAEYCTPKAALSIFRHGYGRMERLNLLPERPRKCRIPAGREWGDEFIQGSHEDHDCHHRCDPDAAGRAAQPGRRSQRRGAERRTARCPYYLRELSWTAGAQHGVDVPYAGRPAPLLSGRAAQGLQGTD